MFNRTQTPRQILEEIVQSAKETKPLERVEVDVEETVEYLPINQNNGLSHKAAVPVQVRQSHITIVPNEEENLSNTASNKQPAIHVVKDTIMRETRAEDPDVIIIEEERVERAADGTEIGRVLVRDFILPPDAAMPGVDVLKSSSLEERQNEQPVLSQDQNTQSTRDI